MRYNHKSFCLLLLILIVLISCRNKIENPYLVNQSIIVDSAAVVSAHPLASQIGVDILKAGGNAVDAAVATQFALAVVYPRAGNIGGGGFMVIRTPGGKTASIDYREKAPVGATRDMYLDDTFKVMDSLSTYGPLAVGVPGTVAGLLEAWRKFGQLHELSMIVEPAIKLAQQGYLINQDEASRLNDYKTEFKKFNIHEMPFVKETKWQAGDLLVQKELAKTLQSIQEKQERGFYGGWVAEKIDSQLRTDGGLVSLEDLDSYQAIWRKPIETNYKEFKAISMAPPSSGGLALAQLLEMIEPYDLDRMGFQSVEAIHLMTEAERRVYADRAMYLGDSDYFDVPDSILLDSAYLVERMHDFDPDKATMSDRVKGGQRIMMESFETTHTSVIDQRGMAVSVTTTLNSNFGSKVWVKDAGFFLNNEMDDFSIKPGFANQFGLVGGEANSIAPGKRMLSSMTPTIIEKNDRLFMVLGTPGGSTIITSVFQVFLNVAEFEMNMTEAVNAPRFHHQWIPDHLIMERDRFDSVTMKSLEEKGHQLHFYEKIGLVKAILVRPDGMLEAVGDPRSFDHAAGF